MIKYSSGDNMLEYFYKQLQEMNIELSEEQENQFHIYFKLLVHWNEKVNLTAITDEYMVYQKHFFDSIQVAKALPEKNISLLDVGSGAGFPSIPLKIIYPEIKVTIIDALNKRIHFLEELTKELKLEVSLIHGRAEEYSKKNHFDIVTARAVANLRILSELCIPFVKPNGFFIAMKGKNYQIEVKDAEHAFSILESQLEDVITYDLVDEIRYLLVIKKIKSTKDSYPRKFSKIKKHPL